MKENNKRKNDRKDTNLRLDTDIKAMIRECAFISGLSMADIINDTLRKPLIKKLQSLKEGN